MEAFGRLLEGFWIVFRKGFGKLLLWLWKGGLQGFCKDFGRLLQRVGKDSTMIFARLLEGLWKDFERT